MPKAKKATKKAVTKKVVKKAKLPKTRPGAKAWSAAEVTNLKKLYQTKTAEQVAKTLRRSLSSVKSKCRALGLTKAKPAAKKKVVKKAVRKAKPTKKTAPRKAVARKSPARKKTTTRKTTAKKTRR